MTQKSRAPDSAGRAFPGEGEVRLPYVRGLYRFGVGLSRLTWFRVGGPAEVLFKPADPEDLAFFLKTKPASIPIYSMGVGSNLLVRDGGIPGVVVRLGRGFHHLSLGTNSIDVGAGVLSRTVALVAQEESLGGFEFLCGIPGTIGGALRMNAGCYGSEIKDILEVAFVIDAQGIRRTLTREEMGFSYRECLIPQDWIFIGARFKTQPGVSKKIAERMETFLAQREATQPIRLRTGGSTFANPAGCKAWELIDQAGCRGLQEKGARVSEQHCNFLINEGTATAEDLEILGEKIRQKVKSMSAIDLRWEIQRLGVKSKAQWLGLSSGEASHDLSGEPSIEGRRGGRRRSDERGGVAKINKEERVQGEGVTQSFLNLKNGAFSDG